MENPLLAFSTELADRVAAVGAFLVSIAAHPRFPSSGIFWDDGLVWTADHTLKRADPLVVTLPSGVIVAAKRVGRDPATDVALLRLEDAAGAGVAGALTRVVWRSAHSGVTASMGVAVWTEHGAHRAVGRWSSGFNLTCRSIRRAMAARWWT